MKIFIVEAVASELFRGNQAGVVVLEGEEEFPDGEYMRNLAAEPRPVLAFERERCEAL